MRGSQSLGHSSLVADSDLDENAWLGELQQLNSERQWFLLQYRADAALRRYPESLRIRHLRALALVNVGAVREALSLIEKQTNPILHRRDELLRAWQLLRAAVNGIGDAGASPPGEQSLGLLADLIREFTSIGRTLIPERRILEDLIGLRGRIHKELWRRSQEDQGRQELESSLQWYQLGYRLTQGYFTGINYATVAKLCGHGEVAAEIAREVRKICKSATQPNYWVYASLGEASLLLNAVEEAKKAFRQAIDLKPSADELDSTRRQLTLLQKNPRGVAIPIPDEVIGMYKPPAVIVFAGHMIDTTDRKASRFPAMLEQQVSDRIRAELDEMDAQLGYSSAASGADMLFVEAMLDRGAEVNIVLPFCKSDFVRKSVEFAGGQWVRRFENVLRLANSVSYVTRQPHLGHDSLFQMCNRIVIGKAVQRADHINSDVQLLTLRDRSSESLVGGTEYVNQIWPDNESHKTIELEEIRGNQLRDVNQATHSIADSEQVSDAGDVKLTEQSKVIEREFRSILFADLKGYSKLSDRHGPAFIDFFNIICRNIEAKDVAEREFVRTSGDGLFVVMKSPSDMAHYAVALRDSVDEANEEIGDRLPEMKMRIALHAALVFVFQNPLNGLTEYYGADVNRTARLEPVTVPGQIYATDQFVALWTAEQVEQQGLSHIDASVKWELVGEIELAKNYGSQRAFHLCTS